MLPLQVSAVFAFIFFLMLLAVFTAEICDTFREWKEARAAKRGREHRARIHSDMEGV